MPDTYLILYKYIGNDPEYQYWEAIEEGLDLETARNYMSEYHLSFGTHGDYRLLLRRDTPAIRRKYDIEEE